MPPQNSPVVSEETQLVARLRVERPKGMYAGHQLTRLVTRNAAATMPNTRATVPLTCPACERHVG